MCVIRDVDENPRLARANLIHQNRGPNPEDPISVCAAREIGVNHLESPETGLRLGPLRRELGSELGTVRAARY